MTAEPIVRTIAVPEHPSLEIPLIDISGAADGPTVNIVGGLAGTAYPGISACRMLAKRLPRLLTKGRVRIVPVVDVAGFYERAARFCPLDGRALAGAFTADRAAEEPSATDNIAQAVPMPWQTLTFTLMSGVASTPSCTRIGLPFLQ